MITAHQLRVALDGTPILRDLDCEVEAGSWVGLLGPNGSGKTTLLNLVAGILRPSNGRITVHETDLQNLDDRGLREHRITRLGLGFQEFELLEYLDVRDNILLPFRINGILTLTPEIRARAERLATRVGIQSMLNRFPEKLSQGERQRAAVCRSLMTEPSLVLADEPTANVDSDTARSLLDLMGELNRQHGITFLFSTHDTLVMDVARRLVRLRDGVIVADERRPDA